MKLIAIEGADGTGKTTLVKNLEAKINGQGGRLVAKGIHTPGNERLPYLRDCFLETPDQFRDISQLVAAADLAAVVQEGRQEDIELQGQGKELVILMDRYVLSGMIYGGMYRKKYAEGAKIWKTYRIWTGIEVDALVVCQSSEKNQAQDKSENFFDDYDQGRLNRLFNDIPKLFFPLMPVDTTKELMDILDNGARRQVAETFPRCRFIESMKYSPEELTEITYGFAFGGN